MLALTYSAENVLIEQTTVPVVAHLPLETAEFTRLRLVSHGNVEGVALATHESTVGTKLRVVTNAGAFV